MLLAASVAAVSCSSGPAPPRTGTPAYYWQVAQENWSKSDFAKTDEFLAKITANESEYVAKAWPFRLTVLAGVIRGHAEIADQYETGARVNKQNPTPFLKRVNDHRGLATRNSLMFLEAYQQFTKAVSDAELSVDFPYPPRGTPGMPPLVAKVQMGQQPTESDVDTIRTSLLQRAMIQQVCDAIGATGDAPKAQATLKTLPVKVPRAAFQLAMANALYLMADLYSPRKAAHSVKQEAFLKEAQAALGKDESKEAKELRAKIEKDLKGLRARRG
jgi:hypothetical protein